MKPFAIVFLVGCTFGFVLGLGFAALVIYADESPFNQGERRGKREALFREGYKEGEKAALEEIRTRKDGGE